MGGPKDDDRRMVVEDVDQAEPGPTEADEEQVLADLYGPAGEDGVYRGDGA